MSGYQRAQGLRTASSTCFVYSSNRPESHRSASTSIRHACSHAHDKILTYKLCACYHQNSFVTVAIALATAAAIALATALVIALANPDAIAVVIIAKTRCCVSGMVTSLRRKQQIYQICSEHDIVIIEDDPYYYLQYSLGSGTSLQMGMHICKWAYTYANGHTHMQMDIHVLYRLAMSTYTTQISLVSWHAGTRLH